MGWGGLLAGGGLLLAGGVVLWSSWLGSQGRLPKGHPLGMRLRSTMASEPAWQAGHRAAAGPLGVGAGVALAAGLAVLAVGTDDVVGRVVVAAGVAALLVGVVVAGAAASRAARGASGS